MNTRLCVHLSVSESDTVCACMCMCMCVHVRVHVRVCVCVSPACSNESSGAVGMSGAMLLTSLPARLISPCLSVSSA